MPNVVLLDGSERIEVGDPLNPANWKMPKSCIEVRREASRKCVEIGSWWPVHGFYLASSQSRRDAPLRADWPRSISPSNRRSVHNNKPGSKWKERFGPREPSTWKGTDQWASDHRGRDSLSANG